MSTGVATGVDALGARRSRTRLLSATVFTGALLAFALPFGTVSSCDGEEVRFTGVELATLTVPPGESTGTLHEDVERNGSLLAFSVLLASALGLLAAIASRRGGGVCATLGLVAMQLLGMAVALSGTGGSMLLAGFWLALLLLAVGGVAHLVEAVRLRRRAGRRVWGYALRRCALALSPTLIVVGLVAIAVLSSV